MISKIGEDQWDFQQEILEMYGRCIGKWQWRSKSPCLIWAKDLRMCSHMNPDLANVKNDKHTAGIRIFDFSNITEQYHTTSKLICHTSFSNINLHISYIMHHLIYQLWSIIYYRSYIIVIIIIIIIIIIIQDNHQQKHTSWYTKG